jgi:hypothetical protein
MAECTQDYSVTAEGTMTEQVDVVGVYGGHEEYRKAHEALAKALAEPSAQGTHAHGARAAFLLAEIAPQLAEVPLLSSLAVFERLGAPKSLLVQMKAFIAERQAHELNPGTLRVVSV